MVHTSNKLRFPNCNNNNNNTNNTTINNNHKTPMTMGSEFGFTFSKFTWLKAKQNYGIDMDRPSINWWQPDFAGPSPVLEPRAQGQIVKLWCAPEECACVAPLQRRKNCRRAGKNAIWKPRTLSDAWWPGVNVWFHPKFFTSNEQWLWKTLVGWWFLRSAVIPWPFKVLGDFFKIHEVENP